MKIVSALAATGLILSVAGCATSSQVQEMIDASYRDSTAITTAHAASIDVLKQSSMAALETNQTQAADLKALEQQLAKAIAQQKVISGNAEAAKLMSAANTVKVAELGESMQDDRENLSEISEKMGSIDQLFEAVMIGYYTHVAESAQTAISALQADDKFTSEGLTIDISEPIEIIAPDTSISTNTVAGE